MGIDGESTTAARPRTRARRAEAKRGRAPRPQRPGDRAEKSRLEDTDPGDDRRTARAPPGVPSSGHYDDNRRPNGPRPPHLELPGSCHPATRPRLPLPSACLIFPIHLFDFCLFNFLTLRVACGVVLIVVVWWWVAWSKKRCVGRELRNLKLFLANCLTMVIKVW